MGEMPKNPLIFIEAVEPFHKNGFIVACSETRQSVYIDPGDEVSRLAPRLESEDLKLVAVLNTHAHLDHISGIGQLLAERKVPIYLHPDDVELYRQLPQQAQWFGLQCDSPPPVDNFLAAGQELSFGSLHFQVYHTPGHAPGHVIFELENLIFCGDTIFAGSIGRTDLPGGSHRVLMQSIRETILPLGDEKILYPGHGPATSIGQERRSNPFLNS